MPNNPKTSPIYSNHVLQAPDGTPISRIGSDRSRWYLDRGLARVVRPFPFRFTSRFPFIARHETPFTIRLNFEPAGRGNEGDSFYLSDKENRCVVCGAEEDINKHHVVPRLYRKCMPQQYKDRTSHDVVILCVGCHTRYEVEADRRKRQIASNLGFSAGVRKLTDLPEEQVREIHARKAAIALVRNRTSIPEERIKLLEDRVREFVEGDLDDEALERFASGTTHYMSNYMGDEMARYVLARVNIQEFGMGWRRHFVEVMRPQHLPAGWDVERPLARAS